MAQIEVRHVFKIFGSAPQKAMARARAGQGKEKILAETSHTVGLSDISLSIKKGEIFVVMGLSGSGKSTLIRHFNRLIEPTAGEIRFEGTDILKLSPAELIAFRRHKAAMVFQSFGLLPHRSVVENVAFGLEVQGTARKRREAAAARWIDAVGLKGYEQQYPSQLSGGMQQRVGLARALCTDPDILLMDEAFSALDPLIRSEMQDQLMALQARLGKTIVFITHDLDEALRIGDRIAILKDGAVSQVGTPADILLNPADDYVRAFVRDVNRARALNVEAIMRPPALRLTTETIDEALARMRQAGAEVGYVVDGSAYRGLVSVDRLSAATGRGRTSLAECCEEGPSVRPDAPIEGVVAAALQSDHPIPVVSPDGDLCGVLNRSDMAQVLDAEAEIRLPGGGPA